MLEINDVSNPFPGLRPFETDENNLFFGRDGQSDELLERLRRSRFLAVVGTSGSGKSSLIRAGLLPALFGGLMGDAGSSWRIAIQRPGGDPIGNLAEALADESVFGTNSEIQKTLIETTLRRSSIGLIDVARQARMDPHENLLVVVDQFEELFRFKQIQSGDDATAFVKLLLEAGAQTELPIYIVLTMRSDFLGDCSQFAGLPEAINNGQYLIPRMSRDERRSAIVGPVAVGEAEITPPLVNRLLNDVGDNPDQLPILQHALMRTWDYWQAHRLNGDPIGLEDYTAIGTMAEALSRHADEAFNELPDERSRLIAEKLFKRLTEKGTDNREIRRPTRLAELCAVCEATEAEVKAVIDVFRRQGRSFLMPPVGKELEADTVVDISHESLIRNWQRLQTWVNEEAQSARTYRRLAEAAALHHEGREALLQDPALQIALDWLVNSKPNPQWGQRYHPEYDQALKYLTDSRQAREAAQLERERQRNADLDRERREREQAQIYAAGQARAARRLRLLLVVMVVLAAFSLVTAGVAFGYYRDAKNKEQSARVSQAAALKSSDEANKALKEATTAWGVAKEQTERFKEQKRIADEQKAKADERTLEAVALKVAALNARDDLEKQLTRNEKSRKANDLFREAALNVQRGKYQEANDSFLLAIREYGNPILNNNEGIADTTVEIGNIALARGKQAYAQTQNFKLRNVSGNLDTAIQEYDKAADIYADKLNALDKAAATNFTLAINLLPLANGTMGKAPLGSGGSVSAGWTAAEGEVPSLTLRDERVGSGPVAPSAVLYNSGTLMKETVKHLQRALSQYRQVYEEHKDNAGDWQTKAARIGRRKAAYQLGDLFLKQSIEDSTNRAYKTEPERQKALDYERGQAVHYFEELLSTFEPKPNDLELGRLLVWLGGLHQAMGENDNGAKERAGQYFNRALTALRQNDSSDADALALIGDTLYFKGQIVEAVDFYQKAGVLYAESGNRPSQAYMDYHCGRIYERLSNLARATDCYSDAVRLYKTAFEQKNSAIPSDYLFAIGSFFRQLGDDARALEAFDLVISVVTNAKTDLNKIYLARAYSERGAILSIQKKPREALDAYRRAIAGYDEVVSLSYSSSEVRQQAVTERERAKLIAKALESVP